MLMRLFPLRTAAILIALLASGGLLVTQQLVAQQLPYQTMEVGLTPKKREIYFYGMRAYPFGRIPQNARLEALLQMDSKVPTFASLQPTALAANRWSMIGPTEVGGRIRTIACHPTDGKTVYIGAADGGVWKSTNAGDSWTPIMDNENAIAMGALAIDPRNPETLYAGTGEMSSNIDAYTGAGIFKTVDGGATWRPIGLTNVGAFSRIVVHPTNSNLIFAGATKNNGGFYRSEDGGNTWTRTFTEAVSDVTVDPANASKVWIGTMSKLVYRSDDGGKTFTQKSDGIGEPGNTVSRISLQAAPSRASTLYALAYETQGSGATQTYYARIYRTTNGGDSWTTAYNGRDFLNLASNAQGWYNNVIAVKPNDPNTVVAGGISIVRATDGGSSGNWYYIDSYASSGAPHPDQHALAYDPANPNRVYLGNDGGLYRSDDNGSTYEKKSAGLAVTQFYAMAVDQTKASRTYGGTQDNGTITTSSTRSGDILGGDGFYVCVDYKNPNIVYGENPNGDLRRLDLQNGTLARIMDGIDANDEAAWSAPLVMDPVTPTTLWHGRHTIYLTFDMGNTWYQTALTLKGQASALAVAKADPNVVYAGSDRGEIFVTQNSGDNWADRTTAKGAPNRAITDFVISPSNAGTAYMACSGFFSGHVFKTTDFGANWTDISGQLPDIPVNALALHPDDENIIYAGSDIGMFISVDGGQTWASYSEGLPRVAVADLEVHTAQRKLRMASHGRSMWEIELEKPTLPPSILSPQGGEVWMSGTQHAISWNNIPAPVRIDYSLDDGNTWNKLIDGVSALQWKIFDTVAVAARIRVTSMADASKTATSRSFTITKFTLGGTLQAAQVTSIPYGLVYDGSYLWASDFGGSQLLKLDPNTLTTIERVQLEASVGDSLFTDLAYNPKNDHLYLHKLNNTTETSPGGVLIEVDKQGRRINRWTSPCAYPIGLVYLPSASGDQFWVSDRNGSQNIYYLDVANPATPKRTVQRARRVQYGPRGATLGPDKTSIYQVITDFTGESLQTAIADKMAESDQRRICALDLTSPLTSGYINARGIELDPRDSNLWVSDYSGSIYKVISCDGRISVGPPPVLGVAGTNVPAGMAMEQNFPNPFSTETRITFTLPFAAHAVLRAYDESGRQVATLADERFESGSHSRTFNASGLPSGVYRCTLTIDGGATVSRSMVHVR